MPTTAAALQELARTFAKLKRPGNLPEGIVSVDLLDEDDITTWFVSLEYTISPRTTQTTAPLPGAKLNVSVKVIFTVEREQDRMPGVFIIQPRLRAPFIHHGALCSLDLMSQNKWTPNFDAVQVLLLTIYRTLDVSEGLVVMHEGDRASHYSSREHEVGMEHIQRVHASLFRLRTNETTTTAEAHQRVVGEVLNSVGSNGAADDDTVMDEKFINDDDDDGGVRRPHAQIPSNELVKELSAATFAELEQMFSTAQPENVQVRISLERNIMMEQNQMSPLIVRPGMHICIVAGTTPVVLHIPKLIIQADATLRLLPNVTLVAPGGIRCSGQFIVDQAEVQSHITVDGRGDFQCHLATLTTTTTTSQQSTEGHYEQLGALLSLFDQSSAMLSATVARQARCDEISASTLHCRPLSTARPHGVLFVSNSASLQLIDGSSVLPLPPDRNGNYHNDDDDLPMKRPRCAVFAEQNASVVLCDSLVVVSHVEGVVLQGCTGSVVRCVFATWSALLRSSCLRTTLLSDRRTGGLCAELGASVTISNCVVTGVYFGFAIIGGSIGQFDGCRVFDSMNGFTVDASVATMNLCYTSCRHVGVFVLNQGKCSIISSVSTTSTVAVDAPPKPMTVTQCVDSTLLDTVQRLCTQLARVFQSASPTTKQPLVIKPSISVLLEICKLQGPLIASSKIGENDEGLVHPTTFVGGLFSIEARSGTVMASSVVCIGADDTAVYVYEGAKLHLSHSVLFANDVNASDVQPTSVANLSSSRATRDRAGLKASAIESAAISDVIVHGFEFAYAILGSSGSRDQQAQHEKKALQLLQRPISSTSNETTLFATQEEVNNRRRQEEHQHQRDQEFFVPITFVRCLASKCYNAFTVDASAASLTSCGGDANIVGVYALNGSRVYIHDEETAALCNGATVRSTQLVNGFLNPQELHALQHRLAAVLKPNTFNGGNYGIEVNNSTVSCNASAVPQSYEGEDGVEVTFSRGGVITVSNAREAGFSCYGNEAFLDIHGAHVMTSAMDKSREVAGVKVANNAAVIVEDTLVERVMFGFLAMDNAQLSACRCKTNNVINGLTVDGAVVSISKCEFFRCIQVAAYILSLGSCSIESSQLEGGTYGVEMKNAGTLSLTSSRLFGFRHTGLRLYGDDVRGGGATAQLSSTFNTVDATDLDIDASSATSDEDDIDARPHDYISRVNCCVVAQRSNITLRRCTLRNARNGCALDLTSHSRVTAWDLTVHDCYKGICLASASECFLWGPQTSISVRNQVILADREAVFVIDGAVTAPDDCSHVADSQSFPSGTGEREQRREPSDAASSSIPLASLEGTQLAVVATRPVFVLGSSLPLHRSRPIRGIVRICNVMMTALDATTTAGENIAALIAINLEDSAACDLHLESITIQTKSSTANLSTSRRRRILRTEAPGTTKTDHTEWTVERVVQLLCLSSQRNNEKGFSGAVLRNVYGIDNSTERAQHSSSPLQRNTMLPIGLGILVRQCSQPIWLEGVKNITMLDIADNVARIVCNESCTFTRVSSGDVPATISLKHKCNLVLVDKIATETTAPPPTRDLGTDTTGNERSQPCSRTNDSASGEFLLDHIAVEGDSQIISVSRPTTMSTAFSILASFAPAGAIHIDETSTISMMPRETWAAEVRDEEQRRSARMKLVARKCRGSPDEENGEDSNEKDDNNETIKRMGNTVWASMRNWVSAPAGAASAVALAAIAVVVLLRK